MIWAILALLMQLAASGIALAIFVEREPIEEEFDPR